MLGKVFKLGVFCLVLGVAGILWHVWQQHQTSFREGVLATVNGVPISLQRVQIQVDSRHTFDATSSFDDMRTAYVEALGTLIVVRLMEQDLAAQGKLPDATAMSAASEAWLREYSPEQRSELFGELVISETEWLEVMRDYHIARQFEQEILGRRVRVPLADIKTVYAEHGEAFETPDTHELCSIQATDKVHVEAMCAALGGAGKDIVPLAEASPVCVRVRRENLPEAVQPFAKKGKVNQCTRIEEQDGIWQAAWLAPMRKREILPIQDAYGLIEAVLRDNGKYEALAQWLEQAVARAEIRIAPEIAPDLLNLQNAEKKLSNPVVGTTDNKTGK